jgi:hypothetical protein
MYGRYSIRLQQLMARSSNTTREEIRYICIAEDKISTLAKHNVDPRHLQLANTTLMDVSQMTPDPIQAIRVGCSFCAVNQLVLVMARVVTEAGFIKSDAEIYPDYVVKFVNVDIAKLTACVRDQNAKK